VQQKKKGGRGGLGEKSIFVDGIPSPESDLCARQFHTGTKKKKLAQEEGFFSFGRPRRELPGKGSLA